MTLTLLVAFMLGLTAQSSYAISPDDPDKPVVSIFKDKAFLFQDDENDDKKDRRRSRRRFTPHWSGFEIGVNDFMTEDYSMYLPAADNYMDLNTGKSFNVNFNFAQLGIGLTRRIGFVTGLGFEINNYHFDGNNNIQKDEDGVVGIYDATALGIVLDKSKFTTVYFTVPLLLEIQVPVTRYRTINIAGGVIGGAKLSSHTKIKYYEGRDKVKDKEKDDYSLNVLRYGPTVRVGYESFQLYATYYMNGLFKEGKGPELYPFQVGVAFTFD